MSDIKDVIGKKITIYRKKANLSQEELADLANIHRTFISQIERGIKSPTISTLSKIMKSLDIKLSDFFKEIENEL